MINDIERSMCDDAAVTYTTVLLWSKGKFVTERGIISFLANEVIKSTSDDVTRTFNYIDWKRIKVENENHKRHSWINKCIMNRQPSYSMNGKCVLPLSDPDN